MVGTRGRRGVRRARIAVRGRRAHAPRAQRPLRRRALSSFQQQVELQENDSKTFCSAARRQRSYRMLAA